MKALEKLGYEVQPIKEVEYPTAHVAMANGDATFLADHWNPLHADYYRMRGGEAKLLPQRHLLGQCRPGLSDRQENRRPVQDHPHLDQLKDPAIAKIFDNDGDGKADLTGCNPGWAAKRSIEHHLDAYELRGTVTHKQGSYSALMADTITRFKAGKPVLYYTWTPYWVEQRAQARQGRGLAGGAVLLAARRADRLDTKLPNGKNYGFVGEQPANRGQQGLGRGKTRRPPSCLKSCNCPWPTSTPKTT